MTIQLLQMPEVTNIGSHSHVGSQALGEVRHRLVDVFLWQLFPDGLHGDFHSSVVLDFGCSNFMVLASLLHSHVKVHSRIFTRC